MISSNTDVRTDNSTISTNLNGNTNTITGTNNWVRKISKTPLTEAQECLLAHGPNFAIVPKEPPVSEYIVVIEKVCQQLKQGEAEELRGEIKLILKKIPTTKPNISKEEYHVLKQQKNDNTRIVLTADMRMFMVVMDREEYIQKSEELLKQPTYKILPTDPTTKHKNELISLLKTIKAEGGINETIYRRLYPTGAHSPKYYGLPKVHKEGMPLWPTVSSVGSVTNETAEELSRILKPLVSRSPHHVKNTKDFIHSLEGIKLKSDEYMSYDVKALFTSVPIQPAINIIKKHLQEDKELHLRTSMRVNHISCLLEFCLKNTYFTFQGRFYEQIEGAAMGSPISLVVANLFMEDLEIKALTTSPCPPSLWKRYVDDTFTFIKRSHKDAFLEHINSIDHNIQFNCEDSREDGSIPFLDILIIPEEDGRLNTTVYRKPTHTDLYLQWDNHHTIQSI